MGNTQSNLFEKPKLTTWQNLLRTEKEKAYFKKILKFIEQERAKGKIIYPANKDIFNALKFTPLDKVKIVIIGQDPYHGPNQAHGLCFSVQSGIPLPPSLRNIYKELNQDLGIPISKDGSLVNWGKQGVLLLNDVLSVQAHNAHSHAKIGWQNFTDKIISIVNEYTNGTIFLLWGAHAKKKGSVIDGSKHHILTAPHPSPLSAHRGFFGCKHFSEANRILKKAGLVEIDW